jgi:hypothetical protein
MFCFCLLAYSEEHINEFNIVAKSLLQTNPEYKIIVGTDSPEQITEGVYKIIKIEEPFNYNLKRVVIEEALKEFNTLMFLDTDIFIRNGIDFSILDKVGTGMHVAEIVNLDKLRDVYGSLDYMKDYLIELSLIHLDDLYLVHEGYFILKVEDKEQRESFIKHWKNIDIQTRPYQRLAYDLPGAMEGIIIWIALQKAKINVKLADKEVAKLFEFISHFGKRNCKLERTLI